MRPQEAGTLRLDLGVYLRAHRITVSRLATKLNGQMPRSTVHSMAQQPRRRIHLGTVSQILEALKRLQGHAIHLDALLVRLPLPKDGQRQRI